MLTGAALIVISRCLDNHPNASTAVLIMGIVIAAVGFINGIIKLVTKNN